MRVWAQETSLLWNIGNSVSWDEVRWDEMVEIGCKKVPPTTPGKTRCTRLDSRGPSENQESDE